MDDRHLERLFERFRERGDVEVLGRVFDETAPQLLRLARRLTSDRSAADDLLQATFLAAIENAKSFDSQRALMPWLAGILVRQASLARRKRKPELTIDAHESRVHEPLALDDPLRDLAARELADALTHALERLSPADREVLVPLLLDEKRAVEIARELGRRPDTVHMRIHRGLERLRRLLPAGFALGWMSMLTTRRALSSVRAEILRHAQRAVAWPQVAATTTSSTAVLGGVLMVKHLALATSALAVALAVGWFALHGRMQTSAFMSARSIGETSLDGVSKLSASDRKRLDEPSVRAAEPARSPVAGTGVSIARIEFVEADGSRPTGALVAVLDAARSVQSLKTDADGRIELAASGEHVDLFIARARSLPFHAALALAAGAQRIDLPAGRELSGRVRVAGAPPERTIELVLSSDRSPFVGTNAADELANVFDSRGSGPFRMKQTCGSDGEFRWTGLPGDWSGSIFVPRIYSLADVPLRNYGEQILLVGAPTTGLVVELTKMPCLVGRVVDARDRTPIVGAQLGFEVEISEGIHSSQTGIATDGAGRFECPLPEAAFDSVKLILLKDARGNGRGAGEWKHSELGPALDLGDIPFESLPARDVHFVVHDSNGSPIAGAVARGDGNVGRPTDEQGRGVLESVPLKTKHLKFGAIGFWSKTIDLSPEQSGPIDVVLQAGNELAIQVEGVPPDAAPEIRVDLVCTEPPFDSDSGWLPDDTMPSKRVGHWISARHSDGASKEWHVLGEPTQDGCWTVENVKPGIALSMQVVGPLRTVLHEEKLAPLAASERRHLVIRIDATSRKIEGRVSSVDGESLSDAAISLWDKSGNGAGTQTDASGRFRFSLLPEGDLELSAEKHGFARRSLRVTAASQTPTPIEVHLERGYDVQVEVVDARGKLVPEVQVLARLEAGGFVSADSKSDARHFVLPDLPAAQCTLRITAGGKIYERVCDPRVSTVRIELPIMGHVAFSWSRTVASESDSAYQVTLRSIDPSAVPLEFFIGNKAEGAHTFEAVVPGDYTIAIETWSRGSSDDTPIFTPSMTPIPLTVAPDQTVQVDLRP